MKKVPATIFPKVNAMQTNVMKMVAGTFFVGAH